MSIRVVATRVVAPAAPPRSVAVQCFAAPEHEHPVAVVDPDLASRPSLPRALSRKIDRFSALAIIAVSDLIDELPRACRRDDVGLFTGNSLGGWGYGEAQLVNLVRSGSKAVHPHQATAWFPAAAQGEVTVRFGLSGFSKTTSGGDLCGCEALLLAIDALDKGEIEYAIAGAVESPLSSFALWGLAGGCPPPTYMYGEGAAFLLLTNHGSAEGATLSVRTVHGSDPAAMPDPGRDVRIPGVDAVIDVIAAVGGPMPTTVVARAANGYGFAVDVDPSEVLACRV